MRRVGSPNLGLRHSNQKENPDAGFYVWPRYQDWKANSRIAARPQIAKRRSAGPLSGAGGFARRITPYHRSRRPHRRRCGASDRRHAVPGRAAVAPSLRPNPRKPVRQGIRLYELPPDRPQINGALGRWYGSCVMNSTPATTCPLRRSPQSNTQKACSISTTGTDHTVPLPDKLRPATSKNAEPKRPARLIRTRTRD
jgi:hypothetical protein